MPPSAPSCARPSATPGARGNPAKVAQAILRLADEKQPPVRLLVGSDAVQGAALAATHEPKRTRAGRR